MNLQDELVRADQHRQRRFSGQVSLDDIKDMLAQECKTESNALQRLGIPRQKIVMGQRSWLQQCRLNQTYHGGVYHQDDVRSICLDYQMRMLPSHLYTGPVDPLFGSKVRRFESSSSSLPPKRQQAITLLWHQQKPLLWKKGSDLLKTSIRCCSTR